MKIFETAKKSLASIELDTNKRPFHRMQLFHIGQSFLAIVSQCLYFTYDANTTMEYIHSISTISLATLVYISYWNAIFNTSTIYELIDHVETIVNESKLCQLHKKNTNYCMDVRFL